MEHAFVVGDGEPGVHEPFQLGRAGPAGPELFEKPGDACGDDDRDAFGLAM
jgi:hypothetical protein